MNAKHQRSFDRWDRYFAAAITGILASEAENFEYINGRVVERAEEIADLAEEAANREERLQEDDSVSEDSRRRI